MLVKQIKDNTDTLVDEVVRKLMAGEPIESKKLSVKIDEVNRLIWRNFIRRTRPYEVKFTKVLKGLFRQQEKEVIANMRKYPKAVSNAIPSIIAESVWYAEPERLELSIKQNWLSQWLFAEMMWRRRFEKAGKPFIGGVLETVGTAELADLVVGIDFDVSNPRVQEFISKNADKFSFATNKTTIDSLRKQLIAGVKLGESIPELTKRVNKVFGFAEKYRATRIARTEILRSANMGAEFAYIQSGVVEGKEWLISAGACDFCIYVSEEMNQRELGDVWFSKGDKLELPDGQIMRIDYGDIQNPPLHPQCKCAITAVLKG